MCVSGVFGFRSWLPSWVFAFFFFVMDSSFFFLRIEAFVHLGGVLDSIEVVSSGPVGIFAPRFLSYLSGVFFFCSVKVIVLLDLFI